VVFIDVHCHLDFKDFDEDRIQLVEEMKEKNIIAISNTTSPENYEYTKKLFTGIDNVKVCPGLYPQDAEAISDSDMLKYLKYLEKNKNDFVAIGEVGLDAHNTTDEKLLELQEKRFRQMLDLAVKLDKPAIIHSRKTEAKVLAILKEYVEKHNFRKFNLHCFMGKKSLIKEIRELRVYCSIPYIVTKTESFQILVRELGASQLLVETDSPFLHPLRQRNSPLSVPSIYAEIAKQKGLDLKEIEIIIYRNYQKLFQ